MSRRLGLLLLLWVAAAVLLPLLGSQPLSLAAVRAGTSPDAAIFWQLRLPRVLLALLAGGLLAQAGACFQALFGNPLAEPYTLGVASGAALGASLAFLFGGGTMAAGLPAVALASFAGALGATALVLLAGLRRRDAGASLLLAGVAVALTCQAVILFVQYLANPTATLRMVRWTMGGLSVVGFREVLWVAPWLAILALVLLGSRRGLDLLLAGEEVATARGLDVPALRRRLLVVVALAVGALVAVSGPLGFVGLMVPHALRRWLGPPHGPLLAGCLLGGGVFLATCDLAARTLLAPAELPVGIVTALLGGPFFLWLLVRGTATQR